MSHIVSAEKVNQFLPNNKLALDVIPSGDTDLPVDHFMIVGLEETARGIVLSKLRPVYDTEGWLVTTAPGQPYGATPELVVSVVAMLVAGWLYDRQFSEEMVEGGSYGQRKVREAYSLLDGIVNGTYDIGVDFLEDPDSTGSTLETEPQFIMEFRP